MGKNSYSNLKNQIEEASQFIRARFSHPPQAAIVFGSALADQFLSQLERKTTLRFEEIPHFQKTTVPGHVGSLHAGFLNGIPLLIAEGRIHHYEGYSFDEVTFPIRLFAHLGVKQLFLTNAAGGLNPEYRVGDLVLLSDHLNLSGENPLHGFQEENFGPRFVSLTNAYDSSLRAQLKKVAKKEKIKVQEGVYVWIAGPSYETEAEVKMFRKLGGDVIGMSTVPEVIVARQMGLEVAAISCITNTLSSPQKKELSHEEVMEQATKNQEKLASLLKGYFLSSSS